MSGLGECGDGGLLGRARAGDVDAFADLYRRHYPAVLAACSRRQGADAEEIAQAAFLRAFERIDQCQGDDEGFGAWVQVIARHVWIDTVRSRSRALARAARAGGPAAAGDWPEEYALRRERLETVRAVVRGLPPRQRQVLYAREVDGRRPREIAAALGVSLGAVDSLLLRARRAAAAGYRTMAAESGLSQTASTAAVAVAGGGVVSGPGRIARVVARGVDIARDTVSRLGGYTGLPAGLDLVAGAAVIVALAGPMAEQSPTTPTARAAAAAAPDAVSLPPSGEALDTTPGSGLPSPADPLAPPAPEAPAPEVPEPYMPPPPAPPPDPTGGVLSLVDMEATVSRLVVPQPVDVPRTGFDRVDRERPSPPLRPGRYAWGTIRAWGDEVRAAGKAIIGCRCG